MMKRLQKDIVNFNRSITKWKFGVLLLIGLLCMLQLLGCKKSASGDVPDLIELQEAMLQASPMPQPTLTPDSNAMAMVEDKLAKLREGRISYNDPGTMQVDNATIIQAFLSVGENIAVSEKIRHVLESAEGTLMEQPLEVSSLMRVRLVAKDSRDFEITPHSSEIQPVQENIAPVWRWSVRPLRPGNEKQLYIHAEAIVRVEGVERTLELPPQTINLTVQVTPAYSARKYGWIGLVLLGIVVGIYFLIQRRQRISIEVQTAALNAALRQELQRLDDVDLSALCLDHFPKVFDKFSSASRRDEKINLVLEYCYRNPEEGQRLEELLKH